MAGFLGKVTAFARSPQGKKLIKQVQTVAKDPATRAKVQAQAQEISKKLKDPATRAKVQEQARGLSGRFKDGKGPNRPGQSGGSAGPDRSQPGQSQQPPADGPAYGTPPNDTPRYGQPPQQ